ncbi:MAG: metalloregulator ArsR/SmtB family transcription factor [Gemmatimonadaceae bacterium]
MTQAPVLDRLNALADFTRSRLLLALDEHELTVGELCAVLQLPQSTVSRHLKVLGADGWVASRAEGTSRFYRCSPQLDEMARALWDIVRQDVRRQPVAREDVLRIESVLNSRRDASRAFFSSAATRWDALRHELYGDALEQSALLGLLNSSWVVGDLGCGTGSLSAVLAPHVARVFAVDGSDRMLDAARHRLQRHANVEVRVGELETLPLPSESLDVGFLILVLHYVAEPLRALRETFRSLRSGGRIVVVDMMPHSREEYRLEMGHVWQGFSADEMNDWMRAAGFEQRRVVPLSVADGARGPSLFVATGVKEPDGALS